MHHVLIFTFTITRSRLYFHIYLLKHRHAFKCTMCSSFRKHSHSHISNCHIYLLQHWRASKCTMCSSSHSQSHSHISNCHIYLLKHWRASKCTMCSSSHSQSHGHVSIFLPRCLNIHRIQMHHVLISTYTFTQLANTIKCTRTCISSSAHSHTHTHLPLPNILSNADWVKLRRERSVLLTTRSSEAAWVPVVTLHCEPRN